VKEDSAREAVEHLQAAAREVGAAVRAFIDSIGDPDIGRSWAAMFEELAKGFGPDDKAEADDPDGDDDGFQPIKVD
jgi:hypothetical protein